MEKVFSMTAGDGDRSYAQNSSFWQKSVLLGTKSILEESIRSWKTLFECDKLLIADLGCSSGPNTLLVTQLITTEIRNKYADRGIAVPEFQIFFNDLPSTDFNSLFRLLSAASPVETSCFVAGVPGSFHNRLFPLNSLHFVHSCYSLHWLSRVPPEVEDRNSKCWNKGRIFISEQGPDAGVLNAYFAQFQKDFNGFLRARAMEVVKGGRMFVVVNGRLSSGRRRLGTAAVYWNWLGSAIQDLVSQKFIEEEKLDSFNMPYYAASLDELIGEVHKEGSFTMVGHEVIVGQRNIEKNDDIEKGKYISKQMRAISENLISYHFGEEMVDVIFNRYAEILATNMREIEEEILKESTKIALILERNGST
ncbi:hypothetical protein SUGI_1027860 [Cryptomeria japonica]|uniref:probable methyltransferase TCM_000168 n=1 Tax=Cryptomeria japonica TaxID=3369 RepID=UPI002414AA10|nr:probable methyltransferase TCM_000168 [Cryptomeria japonica]GLJ48739.1 hypothetical protein SUGI_1027860 [Cryptomeria japonica]